MHFLNFFAWLSRQSGSDQGWCERSGPSLELFEGLARTFPNGRFVHLHRDGLHAALSMRAHALFNLMISIFHHPLTEEEAQLAASAPIDDTRDPIVRRMTVEAPSIEECARYWSAVVVMGVRAAAQLGRDQYMEVRFEDLLADPEAVLEAIARFFGLEAERGWMREAAQMADRTRPITRLPLLNREDFAILEAACEPGQRALGRAAVLEA